MRIMPTVSVATAPSTGAPTSPPAPTPAAEVEPRNRSAWTNPAASAAMRSTAQMLATIESGIIRNMQDVDFVRGYAFDLRATMSIFETATDALTSDGSAENDSFLPLINTAGGGVEHAEARLSAKEIQSTWPLERGDILAAIRRARSISENVADQLDPRDIGRSPSGRTSD